MKKIFLFAIISVIAFKLKAQHHDDDTLKIKWKNSRIWIFDDKTSKADSAATKEKKEHKNFTHWGGFDIGLCMLTTADNQFKISNNDIYNTNKFLELKYNRSWYFSLNLFEKNIRLYKNYAYLITGLGVEWDSYSFKNNIILNSDSSHTNDASVSIDTNSSHKYIKNQLKAAYIKIPLMIEFNTNNSDARKSFHLAAGMEFGYKIDSWTKQIYETSGYTVQVKKHADYNLANFKYGVAVRAGYGGFTLFANYALSPLFDKDRGPEIPVYPLSAGLAITF